MLDCLQDAADAESAKTTYDEAFFGALNVFEVENLLAYRKQFPGQAYQLNPKCHQGPRNEEFGRVPTYLDPQLRTATWFLIGSLVATRQTVAARLWKIVNCESLLVCASVRPILLDKDLAG